MKAYVIVYVLPTVISSKANNVILLNCMLPAKKLHKETVFIFIFFWHQEDPNKSRIIILKQQIMIEDSEILK